MAFSFRSSRKLGECVRMVKAMSSGPTYQISKGCLDTEKIVSASISSVSPPDLVAKALSFHEESSTASVKGQQYRINK